MKKNKVQLAIIVPTKNRLLRYNEFLDSYKENGSEVSVVYPVLDRIEQNSYSEKFPILVDDNSTLVHKLNYTSKILCGYDYYAFMADDLVIHTKDFDKRIIEIFEANPHIEIIYWNDRIHKEKYCNHWTMRASTVKRIGFFALPTCKHMYIDNFWMTVGKDTNSIYYADDIDIEHKHWSAGAEMDDTYRLTSNEETMRHDETAYNYFMQNNYQDFLKIFKNEN